MFSTVVKFTDFQGRVFHEYFEPNEFKWALEIYKLAKSSRRYAIDELHIMKPLKSVELFNSETDKKILPL